MYENMFYCVMMQVPFGDKDQCGEFTLRHGDWVQFQVATDRRDQLKRATNISLLDESFNVSGERSNSTYIVRFFKSCTIFYT